MSREPCNTPGGTDTPCVTRRQYVPVRLNPSGVAAIEAAAEQSGVTRSAMIRAMLAYATDHLPDVQRRLRNR